VPRPEHRQLRLRHLQAFLSAVRHGNFSKASEELHLSAAAVGQAIAELEDDLGEGVKLFERGQTGAKITPQGEALIEHAERLLADAEAARHAVRSLTHGEAATLCVRYVSALAGAVTATIESLLSKHPGLCVEASEVDAEQVPVDILNDSAELGLTNRSGLFGTEVQAIAEDTLWCFAGSRHPLGRKEHSNRTVSLASLEHEPFAVGWLRTQSLKNAIEGYFNEHGFKPTRVVFESNRLAPALAVVRAGLAVTVLPSIDVAEFDSVTMLALDPAPPVETIALLREAGRALSPAAEAFAEEVRGHILAQGLGISATTPRIVPARAPEWRNAMQAEKSKAKKVRAIRK
jgi:DNA-binding transcriptional LysR family regulator